MKKLLSIDGSCALVALKYISGIDEDTMERLCTANNFKPEVGMFDEDWKKVAKILGIKIRSAIIEVGTLKQFVKSHPDGLFLVCTHDHIFVVDNGVVFDPKFPNAIKLKRVIKQAWKVTKPS